MSRGGGQLSSVFPLLKWACVFPVVTSGQQALDPSACEHTLAPGALRFFLYAGLRQEMHRYLSFLKRETI